MKLSDYIVKELNKIGVTEAFGVPGGVLLDLMYSMDSSESIDMHLSYSEQGAAYAAIGCAQMTNKPVIAYATHGPGIMSMLTAVAEAYVDSAPVIFITAHTHQKSPDSRMRVLYDQEFDAVSVTREYTKKSVYINNPGDIDTLFKDALISLMSGRKGPVLLDFDSRLLKEDYDKPLNIDVKDIPFSVSDKDMEAAAEIISKAKRPAVLIGDGVNLSGCRDVVVGFAEKNGIPVISSKVSQDAAAGSPNYFGYIGSHGIRYANFILAKSDCIISIGNRLAFNKDSASFAPVIKKQFIRIDADENEFERVLPNAVNIRCDVRTAVSGLSGKMMPGYSCGEWLKDCMLIKSMLLECDINSTVKAVGSILASIDKEAPVVCDVGNNELWTTRAYEYKGIANRKIHSKSFKTAGSALAKSVGAYYAVKAPVVCVMGDQGFQFNLQELNAIRSGSLPVCTVVVNNHASGMIRDLETRSGRPLLQVSEGNGYSSCDIRGIAQAYGINYIKYDAEKPFSFNGLPVIVEIEEDELTEISPVLPKGEPCQNLFPYLDKNLYNRIEAI